MKKHLKLFSLLLAFGMAFTFTACDEDDGNDPEPIDQDNDNVVVTQNISEDTRWTADNIYQLAGRITVLDGATLTIDPGTVIKGEMGTGANATALLVARGGKLMAEGSATLPIIFTTVGDEITPEDIAAGDFASPNLDPDANGLWGGILIMGKAPISASNKDTKADVSEVQIEGIPTSDPNGLYGGSEEEDNSGVIKYVSIRHGGANIGAGNEINGLTLGGVGSKTIIENVEIIANQDDGIEWFGGNVSIKNAVVWNTGDDAIDADQSWTGTLDNFVVIAPGDHNFELDGPEGSADYGAYTIKNGVIVANFTDVEDQERYSSDLINTDDNTSVTFDNLFFTAIEAGQMVNRVEHTVGAVSFSNIVFDVDAANLGSHFPESVVPEGFSAGTAPADASAIDLSVFSWTWANQAGAIPTL
ncbi:hypothetical protein [Geofilum rubicundum]|uniref:Lipoprotein n=1 Tax=Geofilum rubicundum JCM 15548 TaxID=1236989 RepID=A0A0E9LU09_9BACT|nr:hypothetical protein [Geofilum rubicundum]GAO28345.1 hypothetical protein JCM15548_1429 [Geofilum rubicundum JCM 15548]